MSESKLGLAVIGAGTIGTLRARLASEHALVGRLCVCDIELGKAEKLAELCGADAVYASAAEAVADPGVEAVVVATSEESHFEPALAAIEAGKPVLVEKPLTIDPAEGARLVAAAAQRGVPLSTGFTQRFRRRFQTAKQHLLDGYCGELTTITARIFLTRAIAETVISRAPTTTPSINTLTYMADLLLWFAEGRRPAAAFACNSRGEISERFGAPDATWSLIQFEDGLVANLGVSWELPRRHPAYVASMEVGLFGREGSLMIGDDHHDQLLVSERGVPSPYPPHAEVQAAMLGSAMPGEWALGRFFGPMKDELDAFLQGARENAAPAGMADGQHGLDVLRLNLAIDRAARSGELTPVER